MLKNFFSGFFTAFLILIVFFSNPGFAYSINFSNDYTQSVFFAEENPLISEEESVVSEEDLEQNNSDNSEVNSGTDSRDSSVDSSSSVQNDSSSSDLSDSDSSDSDDSSSENNSSSVSSAGSNCSVSKLSPKEAKGILDLTHEGFDGNSMSDGKSDSNANSKTDLNGLGLIANDNDGKNAIKIVPPTQGTLASRYGIFDKVEITGPWGIGLVLDDTLRIGRCEEINQENCRIMGNGTSYRTSGVGIKAGFANAFTALTDTVSRKFMGVSEEEFEKMQNNVFDNGEDNLMAYSIEESDKIKNSFKTTSYIAKKSSNCNNAECVIATYSAFDKYFNSWYSVDMVVSSFGPTLVHKAGKLMGVGATAPQGSFWNKTGKLFDDAVNKAKRIPLEAVGLDRLSKYKKIVQEYPNLRTLFDSDTIGKKLFSAGEGGKISDMFKAGGALEKLSAQEKEAFFKATDHLRSWIKLKNSAVTGLKTQYKAIIDNPALPLAQRQAAQLEYGKEMGKVINDFDDFINLDFPEWIKDSGSLTQLSNISIMKAGYGTGGASGGVVNLATEGSFNLKKAVITPFSTDGSWASFAGKITDDAYKVDNLGNLVLYELKKGGANLPGGTGISVDELVKRMGQGMGSTTVGVSIPGQAGLMELNDSTIKYLTNQRITTVDLVTSEWVPRTITENGVTRQAVLTPNEFASMITQDRVVGRVGTTEINLDEAVNIMRQDPSFTARRNWSFYDSQIAKEKNFIVDYYKKPFEVGIWKGTLLPVAYWNMKRGMGFEQISGYMLPDKWTNIEIYQGSDQLYKDSYTDFFANEGSDQGDIFMKAISSGIFVWKYMADNFTKEIAPVFYDPITRFAGTSEGIPTGGFSSKSITRDIVGDVAFYSHNENCSGCSGNFKVDSDYLSLNTALPVNIQAFLVEAVDQATAREKGTTLIAYTHHSDIKGKTADIEGDKIALVQARTEGTTCEQALKETGMGFVNPKLAGLALAAPETMIYTVFGLGAGITATVFQQTMMTRKLQDCVDDLEGYYIHLFSPSSYNKTSAKQVVSNETISDTISKMSDNLTQTLSNNDGNPVSDSLQKINDEFKQFADQAKNDNILQANLQLNPPSYGGITGKEVFYIWYKEKATPSGYKTDGKLVIKDGNKELIFDNETGELKYNGKTIIGSDKADHIRMATTPSDNRLPGIVVPVTLNKISAPQTTDPVFELYSNGEIKVLNSEVLSCIQKAVKDQTGITYTGNELTSVFGNLNGLNTDLYSKIFSSEGKIMLEGSGPRVEGSGSAKLVVDGYWETKIIITPEKQSETGKFQGMNFEHGSIVLKEETNELVIWLRQHKESVLSNKEVSGLKAKLTNIKDPDTECEIPAINLEAIGQAGDELGQQRVKNFNTSMDHLGPFTQFSTDSKIYEFYSVLDGNTGECKDYFRIRDKDTGEIVYDGEIKGGVKQAEDGTISFETTDGKKHELKFDAENGVPKLTYNNGAPETLRSAQGPNGSFWYDPNTGLWYPENGLQIPLNQAFKDNGTLFASDGKGGIAGTPSNPVTLNVGTQGGQGINLPSLPETITGYVLFITSFLMISYIITQKPFSQKQKKKK